MTRYTVSLFGSDRAEGNDDNHIGDDCATLEEAHAILEKCKGILAKQKVNWAFAYIDHGDEVVHEERNPNMVPAWDRDDDSAEISERYMVGMERGIDAFNEANGEPLEEPDEPPAFKM